LSVSITAFVGEQDTELLPEYVEPWNKETSAPFNICSFSGDHFYLIPQKEKVLAEQCLNV
jgi:pyochelin biosynthetic protein PchC